MHKPVIEAGQDRPRNPVGQGAHAAAGLAGVLATLTAGLPPWHGAAILILVLGALESASALLQPWIAGRLAGLALANGDILPWLGAWAALAAAQAGLSYWRGVRAQTFISTMNAEATSQMLRYLLRLPQTWHDRQSRGGALSLLMEDVHRLARYPGEVLLPMVPALLIVAGAMLAMLRMDLRIGLLIGVAMPALFIIMRLASRATRGLAMQTMHDHAMRYERADRSLAMVPAIKAFTAEHQVGDAFAEASAALCRSEVREARVLGMFAPGMRLAATLLLLAVLAASRESLAARGMGAGELVQLLLYGLLLVGPLGQLALVYGQTQSARASARRLGDVLAVPPEADNGLITPAATAGEVRFEEVHFGYPGRGTVLAGLDLRLYAGEAVAITGHNGAGKTTLARLLLRLLEPDRGRILLDGVDVRDIPLGVLRKRVGMMAQDVLLANDTVAANLRLGSPLADDAAVQAASRAALADEFIRALPQGYDTLIGDQGVLLSGGQRQRLALARLLLRDPAVVILDEGTSMLDAQAELAFVESCRKVLAGKTLILITHRPATLALADRILRLEGGVLVAG